MNSPKKAAGDLTSIQFSLFAVCVLSIGCVSGQSTKKTTPSVALITPYDTPITAEETPLPPKFEITERVEVKTSMGSFVMGLYGNDAPETVENFLRYIAKGIYSNTVFHRVIAGFMIQGGGFDADLKRIETDLPLDLEIIPGLKHEPGIVSMARTTDPHSATSQFFVCIGNAPQLNGTYAAFGRIESGIEVIRSISTVPTKTVESDYGTMADVPSSPVVIESVTLL